MGSTTPLAGRHALVCGASAGIGRAVALALGEQGAMVSVVARRADCLATVVEELQALRSPSPAAVVADLDDLSGFAETARRLLLDRGDVQILINNSGGPPSGLLLEATAKDFEQAMTRHLLASHALVQAVLAGMRRAGYGRIINIVSISVREPLPNLGVSNTVRGAMAAWSKTLARELPPGITINNVLPGYTDTERLRSLRQEAANRTGRTEAEVTAAWLASVPEGRLARPEEIAAAVAFLASPGAGYIRGVSLPVDGGRLMAL